MDNCEEEKKCDERDAKGYSRYEECGKPKYAGTKTRTLTGF